MARRKPGPKPQAYAFLQRMLDQDLIVQLSDGSYVMTEKGKEEAARFQQEEAA